MQPNVLICPLYWGTGHATRMAALSARLREKGFRIFVAAPEVLFKIFDETSLEYTRIKLGSFRIRYPVRINLAIALLFQAPVMLLQSMVDHYKTSRIVKKHNIDIIFSDNRFGCFNGKVYSIYITHQLNIMSTTRENRRSAFFSSIHRLVINRYDECWIPDLPGEKNLSGELSHPANPGIPYKYIGLLSCFKNISPEIPSGLPESPFDLLILSGPEPMKSHFEKRVVKIYGQREERLVITGSELTASGLKLQHDSSNITRYGYLSQPEVKYLSGKCSRIICRPGYSTLMDLVSIGKKALLVPTPGQSEQVYLASYLSTAFHFPFKDQANLEYNDIEISGENRAEEDWIEESTTLTRKAIDNLPR